MVGFFFFFFPLMIPFKPKENWDELRSGHFHTVSLSKIISLKRKLFDLYEYQFETSISTSTLNLPTLGVFYYCIFFFLHKLLVGP